MTDEQLRKAIQKINGNKRLGDEALMLWRKYPALRVITAWRWEGQSGLSLPTIAYLSGIPMRLVRKCFEKLDRKVCRTYCGDTGHVIYYPSLERSGEMDSATGRFVYSNDLWCYRDAWTWGSGEAGYDEKRLFTSKVYPHQRSLNKKTDEYMRMFSVPEGKYGDEYTSGAIPKRRWNRLKRAVRLSG